MKIENNVIKEYLKNVYFVAGTACGGKTTTGHALAQKYGMYFYDADEEFERHRSCSDRRFQPSMNTSFSGPDEFFGRSVEEYRNWLLNNEREQLDFIVLDLIRLSQDRKVICDGCLTLEQAKEITDPSRVAFLIKEPIALVDEYCNRPDHQDFSNFIHSASDYESAKAVCNETLMSVNMDFYKSVKESDFFWLERDPSRSLEETVALVEKHMGLSE